MSSTEVLSRAFYDGLMVVNKWLHSRECLKIATFVVNLSFQGVTQTVKRKNNEDEGYSPAGKIPFFPYFYLSQITVPSVPAMLKL